MTVNEWKKSIKKQSEEIGSKIIEKFNIKCDYMDIKLGDEYVYIYFLLFLSDYTFKQMTKYNYIVIDYNDFIRNQDEIIEKIKIQSSDEPLFGPRICEEYKILMKEIQEKEKHTDNSLLGILTRALHDNG